jgi:hypothetical protein
MPARKRETVMAYDGAITVSRWGGDLGFLSWLDRTRSAHGSVTALKFIDTSGGIDKFLLAGEKGMACRANADFDIVAGRARAIRRTAGTNDHGFDVVGVNLGLHFCGKLSI